jgi:ATP-dependent Clp protease ATP-binding subunit ClpB
MTEEDFPAPDLTKLDAFLRERIQGQEFAASRVTSAVQRAELGLRKANRPKGVFLFLGPTGVGKTETTLNLSRFLYGDEDAVARFDMGEYGHDDSIQRLLGDSRGSQGLLGDAIDARPNGGILLLDEIEKAHPRVSKVFLAATDAARVTMSTGETKDLSDWYIVFTSNLGSGDAVKMEGVPYSMLERTVMQAATAFFAPETIARFQHKIVFNSLGYEIQRCVAIVMIDRESRLIEQAAAKRYQSQITVSHAPEVVTFLVRRGYSREMGARHMRDAIETHMGEPVARWMLSTKELLRPTELRFTAPPQSVSLSLLSAPREAGKNPRHGLKNDPKGCQEGGKKSFEEAAENQSRQSLPLSTVEIGETS